jgi:hypothetical protein
MPSKMHSNKMKFYDKYDNASYSKINATTHISIVLKKIYQFGDDRTYENEKL